MGVLIGLMMTLLFLTCVLMIVVIVFQDNKAGGLAGAFGGGAPDSPFGARGGERLARWTLYLGIAFFVLVIALGLADKGRSTVSGGPSGGPVPVSGQPQAPAPSTPPPPPPAETPSN